LPVVEGNWRRTVFAYSSLIIEFRMMTVTSRFLSLGILPLAVQICWAAALLTVATARAEEFEAVNSRASGDYVRKTLRGGAFVPESYVFAKGGYWSGPLNDASIDKMEFMDIARTIAVPLANEGYLPTANQNKTKLLLVVYWGTTYAPEHASDSNAYNFANQKAADEHQSNQRLLDAERTEGSASKQPVNGSSSEVRQAKTLAAMDADELSASLSVAGAENQTRDQANMRNAAMLGYDSEWKELTNGLGGPAHDFRKSAMVAELEEDRYFVVIMAYDYQLLVGEKKHKLLWETRFSIRQHNHAFDKQLASMTAQAAKFFGRDSNGLTHKPLPEGHVEIGGVRNLGDVPVDQVKAKPQGSDK